MPVFTIEEFLARFPQFDGQEDQAVLMIPEIELMVGENWNTATRKIAAMYLLAHMLITESAGDSLPLVAASLGPISVRYAEPKLTGMLESTEFGRRYLQLRGKSFVAGIVVV